MSADICLILEGTYPFVRGGVSSWVHRIATCLEELTFHIVHISPRPGFYEKGRVYTPPKNVVGIDEVFLHDYAMNEGLETRDSGNKVDRFRDLLDDLRGGRVGSFAPFVQALQEGLPGVDAFDLLQTRDSWRVLVDAYRSEARHESFLNFFWTWRYTYLPVLNLLAAEVPEAGAYHAISTGYAGALAAAAKIRTGRPMLLTEHGIYAKERRIEINRAEWIADWESGEVVAERNAPFFRRFWRRHFGMLSRICYEHSDQILTLFGGNRSAQIADGAPPGRIDIVPNGVDLARFADAAKLHDERAADAPFTTAFVGRVTPIKDVLTYVYAMRVVVDRLPDARGRILGPCEEDPDYANEVRSLVTSLGLSDNVTIEGSVDVVAESPHVDVLVLTSVSEGQPLIILEGGAVGIPIVSTRVGSCDELLNGRTVEDKRIGVGGLLTAIASPGETASAILRLHDDPEMRRRLGKALQRRVHSFHDERDMIRAYRLLYERYLSASAVA